VIYLTLLLLCSLLLPACNGYAVQLQINHQSLRNCVRPIYFWASASQIGWVNRAWYFVLLTTTRP